MASLFEPRTRQIHHITPWHVAPEEMEGGLDVHMCGGEMDRTYKREHILSAFYLRGVTYFSGKLSLQDVRATVNGCVYHHVSRCVRHEGTEEMEGDIHSDRH